MCYVLLVNVGVPQIFLKPKSNEESSPVRSKQREWILVTLI
jgi:hypothetical protein